MERDFGVRGSWDENISHDCTLRGELPTIVKKQLVHTYTVVMLLTFVLTVISISSPPRSFIPGLKPSFSAVAVPEERSRVGFSL